MEAGIPRDTARNRVALLVPQTGANADVDAAVAALPAINAFLRQDLEEITPAEHAWAMLAELTATFGGAGR